MVPNGNKWCRMVTNDAEGTKCCQMVSIGTELCQMVLNGAEGTELLRKVPNVTKWLWRY